MSIAPISRVSRHESTKGDGHFDKHTVFADNLLLPRMVLPLDKGRVHDRCDRHYRSQYLSTIPMATASQIRMVPFLQRRPARWQTWSISRAAWCGRWITGSTPPTTPIACAGLPMARAQGTDRAERRPMGLTQDNIGQALVVECGRRKRLCEFPSRRSFTAPSTCRNRWRRFRWKCGRWSAWRDLQGGLYRVRGPMKDAESFHRLWRTGSLCACDRLPADLRGDCFSAGTGRAPDPPREGDGERWHHDR